MKLDQVEQKSILETIEHLEKRRTAVKTEIKVLDERVRRYEMSADVRRYSHLGGRLLELDHVIAMFHIANEKDLELPLEAKR